MTSREYIGTLTELFAIVFNMLI